MFTGLIPLTFGGYYGARDVIAVHLPWLAAERAPAWASPTLIEMCDAHLFEGCTLTLAIVANVKLGNVGDRVIDLDVSVFAELSLKGNHAVKVEFVGNRLER